MISTIMRLVTKFLNWILRGMSIVLSYCEEKWTRTTSGSTIYDMNNIVSEKYI